MSGPGSKAEKNVGEVLKDCGKDFKDRVRDCKRMFKRED